MMPNRCCCDVESLGLDSFSVGEWQALRVKEERCKQTPFRPSIALVHGDRECSSSYYHEFAMNAGALCPTTKVRRLSCDGEAQYVYRRKSSPANESREFRIPIPILDRRFTKNDVIISPHFRGHRKYGCINTNF